MYSMKGALASAAKLPAGDAPPQPPLNGTATAALSAKSVVLSDREIDVLIWVARDKTSSEIATILGLTKRTVDFHVDRTRAKLYAATRAEAVIKATIGG